MTDTVTNARLCPTLPRMLARIITTILINVAEGAMWLFGWDRPKGLLDVWSELVGMGYDIPEPDHTAEGDVRTTRAAYYALRAIKEES